MGKVRDRARSFYPVSRTLSVQRRIHLFNIFILPLLYYLMAFYILPECYRKEIECIMRRMVVPFRTGFRLVHLYQPPWRVAPQKALKDPWVVNAALLGAKGDFKAWHGAARAPKLGTESLLITDQILASVTDTVKWGTVVKTARASRALTPPATTCASPSPSAASYTAPSLSRAPTMTA